MIVAYSNSFGPVEKVRVYLLLLHLIVGLFLFYHYFFFHFLQLLTELENLKIRVSILVRSNSSICIVC